VHCVAAHQADSLRWPRPDGILRQASWHRGRAPRPSSPRSPPSRLLRSAQSILVLAPPKRCARRVSRASSDRNGLRTGTAKLSIMRLDSKLAGQFRLLLWRSANRTAISSAAVALALTALSLRAFADDAMPKTIAEATRMEAKDALPLTPTFTTHPIRFRTHRRVP